VGAVEAVVQVQARQLARAAPLAGQALLQTEDHLREPVEHQVHLLGLAVVAALGVQALLPPLPGCLHQVAHPVAQVLQDQVEAALVMTMMTTNVGHLLLKPEFALTNHSRKLLGTAGILPAD